MANFVYNYIEVYGKEDDLKKFKRDVALNDETVFSFNKIIPMPENTSSWAVSGMPSSYAWGLEHWGTEYDCGFSELNEENNHLAYEFTTHWTAPQVFFEKIIHIYIKLTFKIHYFESTNNWSGDISASGGEITKYYFSHSDYVHWKDNLFIGFDYSQDVLNDQKIEIYDPVVFKLNLIRSKNDPVERSCGDLDDDALIAELDNM